MIHLFILLRTVVLMLSITPIILSLIPIAYAKEDTNDPLIAFGRLLTTPDERVRMDNLRASKSQLGVDKKLTYRGVVKKDGREWIWLNDQVINAKGDSALSINRDKSLSITVNDRLFRLSPGQTLIPAQGIIEDPMNAAKIRKN